MGAAATGSVSGNTARKDGKRYTWGAERPGVIEKRVQSRKQQIDAEMAKIREEGEQWIARRLAAKEAEKKKLDDQEVLVAEHRKALKERRRAFRVTNSYIVPKGTFTDEQIAAIKAQYPGIDDEEAHLLLSKRARQTEPDVSSPEPVSPQETDAAVPSVSDGPSSVVEQRAKPVEAPKVVASEKPKPVPVHIEAAVTFSAGAGEAERDWSDFDPEAWEEGQDYPEHLYRAVPDRDRNLYLVPQTDMEEGPEPVVTPEIQALRDRQRKLERAQDEIFEKFGRNSMLWSSEVNAEVGRLDEEATEVSIQLRKALAAR
ncbi:hypothetical protein [Microvirga calopogonii]|uniref:hypothetical protein n=1 Tax=Microvirga calopogonii TaxID=2078013 RepID=UPI000E0DAA4E|nr:hypothetical protein [Microvirga calopogonii]